MSPDRLKTRTSAGERDEARVETAVAASGPARLIQGSGVLTPERVAALQTSAGNRLVAGLLRSETAQQPSPARRISVTPGERAADASLQRQMAATVRARAGTQIVARNGDGWWDWATAPVWWALAPVRYGLRWWAGNAGAAPGTATPAAPGTATPAAPVGTTPPPSTTSPALTPLPPAMPSAQTAPSLSPTSPALTSMPPAMSSSPIAPPPSLTSLPTGPATPELTEYTRWELTRYVNKLNGWLEQADDRGPLRRLLAQIDKALNGRVPPTDAELTAIDDQFMDIASEQASRAPKGKEKAPAPSVSSGPSISSGTGGPRRKGGADGIWDKGFDQAELADWIDSMVKKRAIDRKHLNSCAAYIVGHKGKNGGTGTEHDGLPVFHISYGQKGRDDGCTVFFTIDSTGTVTIVGIGSHHGAASYRLDWRLDTWTSSKFVTANIIKLDG